MRISNKYILVLLMIAVAGCATTSNNPAPNTSARESAKDPVQSPSTSGETIQKQSSQESESRPETALPSPPSTPPNPAVEEQTKPSLPSVDSPDTVTKPSAAPVPEKKPAEVVKSAPPIMPNTFNVTADEKNQNHPFFGKGHKAGFLVNGEPGKELVLTRGETYKFNVDTGVQHDFYFSSSPVGWGSGTVTEGVKGQFTYQGTVTFTPATTTPSLVYYQCRNHKSMGGRIYVLEKGESLAAVKSRTQETTIGEEKTSAPTTAIATPATQLQQKISYAETLIGSSEAAKRIDASSNTDAKALKADAQKNLANAKNSVAAGDAVKAQSSVDEALKLITSATQLVSMAGNEQNYEARYKELSKEIKTYEKTLAGYQAKNTGSNKANFDQKKYTSLVNQAESSATRGDYKDGSRLLSEASTMITAALSTMLDSTTVVYDKDFKTPQEEYEYEFARYQSYVELIPVAKQERHPSASQIQLMDNFVKKAEQIANEGKAIAAKGDHSLAIQAMQAATENVRQALMVAGVR